MKSLKVKILIILIFLVLNGCLKKKELKLEEKKIVKEIISEEVKNFSKENEKKDISLLEPKFVEKAGKVNPFVSPSETGISAGVPSGIAPSVSSLVQFPTKIPAQIPPLPQQEEETPPSLEVPKWPTQPAILVAGPRSSISSLFNFKLTGIVYDTSGKRKYAIIEETLQETSPATTGETTATGGRVKYRSYIVKEGEVIPDYQIKVKTITPNKVVLVRGNQKIDLALLETPKPLLLPTYGKVPASEVR